MRSDLLANVNRNDAARIRSCGGRNCARWLTACPYIDILQIKNTTFQCLLRRRLGLALHNLDTHTCNGRNCRAFLDMFGHHLSTCMRSGRVHARHTAGIKPWKMVLEEAGFHIRIERMLNNTHLRVHSGDRRRMDIVAAPAARNTGAFHDMTMFLRCDNNEPFKQKRRVS